MTAQQRLRLTETPAWLGLTCLARLVWHHLRLIDDAGVPGGWPSVSDLAATLDVTPRAVRGSLAALERAGLIWRERREGANGANAPSRIVFLAAGDGRSQ